MISLSNNDLKKERKNELLQFQRIAGIRFKNIDLLNRSFTHRSYSNDHQNSNNNNERLEFLGDSVLGLCVAGYIFTELEGKNEGELARIKSYVVSEDSLSSIALDLKIDTFLLIGKGEENSGGRTKKAILADALEAVIGAYYIDQGYTSVNRFVLDLLIPEIEKVLQNKHKKDYKTIIQEFVQKTYKEYPKYTLTKKSGPDHDRTYSVCASINGKQYPEGSGKNKKEAEQQAAKNAYDEIVKEAGIDSSFLQVVDTLRN